MRGDRRRLIGRHIPTTEGRELLVRPGLFGEGMQLAIIGKRGAIVEATGIGLADVPGLVFAIDGVSEIAWTQQQKQLEIGRDGREHRHAVALDRNPWLNGKLKKEEVAVYG